MYRIIRNGLLQEAMIFANNSVDFFGTRAMPDNIWVNPETLYEEPSTFERYLESIRRETTSEWAEDPSTVWNFDTDFTSTNTEFNLNSYQQLDPDNAHPYTAHSDEQMARILATFNSEIVQDIVPIADWYEGLSEDEIFNELNRRLDESS